MKIKWIDGNSRGTINECIFSMCALSKDEGNRKEWTYESKQIMPKKCKEKKNLLWSIKHLKREEINEYLFHYEFE